MKTNGLIFILAALAAFMYMLSDTGHLLLKVREKTVAAKPVNAEQKTPASSEFAQAKPARDFAQLFKEEYTKLSKNTDQNSESVEQALKKIAATMSDDDISQLAEVISDNKNHSDMRSMALDLLSIKNNTASLVVLQSFVGSNKNIKNTKENQKELETVLKAQAVESIAAYPQKEVALSTLHLLEDRVEQKFLKERIARATSNVLGEVRMVEEESETDLKNLVE